MCTGGISDLLMPFNPSDTFWLLHTRQCLEAMDTVLVPPELPVEQQKQSLKQKVNQRGSLVGSHCSSSRCVGGSWLGPAKGDHRGDFRLVKLETSGLDGVSTVLGVV